MKRSESASTELIEELLTERAEEEMTPRRPMDDERIHVR